MVNGGVAERTFLHWSSWTNQVDSLSLDTSKAWVENIYWTHKTSTDEWVYLGADGSFSLGTLKFPRGHELEKFMRRMKYSGEVAKEYIFEDVRQREFASLPSRWRCMYLFDETDDPKKYARVNGILGRPTLYRVEVVAGTLHRGKFAALNCNTHLHREIVAHAREFWTCADPSFDTEVLFEGTCNLTRVR